jgi:putative addiction module component (TIGR02574 family)
MDKIPLSEILKLTVAERLQLIESIWDSIAAEPEGIPLTDEGREELDRRLDDAEANPGVGSSWADVKARLLVPE